MPKNLTKSKYEKSKFHNYINHSNNIEREIKDLERISITFHSINLKYWMKKAVKQEYYVQ